MENMEIFLKTRDKPEIDKITAILKTMSDTEKDKMLIFMQGMELGRNLALSEREGVEITVKVTRKK